MDSRISRRGFLAGSAALAAASLLSAFGCAPCWVWTTTRWPSTFASTSTALLARSVPILQVRGVSRSRGSVARAQALLAKRQPSRCNRRLGCKHWLVGDACSRRDCLSEIAAGYRSVFRKAANPFWRLAHTLWLSCRMLCNARLPIPSRTRRPTAFL